MDSPEDRLGSPTPARIVEEIANKFREAAGIDDEPQFDVAQALWRLAKLPGLTHGLRIVPCPDDELGNKEAWATTTSPPTITIRQSRFVNSDDPDTRFILAHELFHVLLHPDARSYRVVGGNRRFNFPSKDDLLAIYHNDHSHEVQADVGARAFLMPAKLVALRSSASDLANHCNVPLREAQLRFSQLKTAQKTPEVVRAFLAKGREQERRRLWDELPVIPGEPPDQTRKAGLYRIAWVQFGMTSECGWTVERGKIVSYFEMCAARLGR